jgi:hypothetical protein
MEALMHGQSVTKRVRFGEFSSFIYFTLIVVLFVLDEITGFNPEGTVLAWCGFAVSISGLVYVSLQMEAIVRRVENDSRDVARDNLFSLLPALALLGGALWRIFSHFAYAAKPPTGFGITEMLAWIAWVMGFWTSFEWMVIIIISIVVLIDIVQYSNATNRITAAARSESRTAG